MFGYELVEILQEPLKRMSEIDIKATDHKHVPMCHEYKKLVAKGAKKDYIKAKLAHKYGISESTVSRILTRLTKQVKL